MVLSHKWVAAKTYLAGMKPLRKIDLARSDMRLPGDPASTAQPMLDKARDEVALIKPPAYSRTANSFGHVFAGGYAAGYYSYKWAEVLSADAYAAFEETAGTDGQSSAETGHRYLHTILESGGSRPAMESFKAFRGREPSLDALLRHQGMG